MKHNSKLQQNLENDYEAQLLNEFYNQENESKKEKLKKVRNTYYKQKTIIQNKIKEKLNDKYY